MTTNQEQRAREVTQADRFALCPWGCAPNVTIRPVAGPEPNFPDRERPIVSCQHARIEGEKRLVVGTDDWEALATVWNTRSTPAPAGEGEVGRLREALQRIAAEAVVPLSEMPDHDRPNGWRRLACERIDIARAALTIPDSVNGAA